MKLSYGFSAIASGALCLSLTSGSALAEANEADTQPVLIELFSNQNCGACPKANAYVIDLYEAGEAFPIVWSVPYWDYLGWKDTFARPEFADRQRDYAENFALRGPYTPQIVVDGCAQASGMSEEAVAAKLKKTAAEPDSGLRFEIDAGSVSVTAASDSPEAVTLWLIGYKPGLTEITPTSGGNADKALVHVNMATSLTRLGEWSGEGATEFSYTCPDEACLIIAQEEGLGDILAYQRVPSQTASGSST